MIRWICVVSLKDRKTSKELRGRLGLGNIRDISCRNRLSWFGHIHRMDDENWVKKVTDLEVAVEG